MSTKEDRDAALENLRSLVKEWASKRQKQFTNEYNWLKKLSSKYGYGAAASFTKNADAIEIKLAALNLVTKSK